MNNKPTKEQLIEINSFFDDYIYKWMIPDLEKMLKVDANLAFTIVIFANIEFLGGFIMGGDTSYKNSNAFFELIAETSENERYKKLKNCLRESYRNGLMHHYHYGKFPIGFALFRDHEREKYQHLYPELTKGAHKYRLYLHLETLLKDFIVTVKLFHLKVQEGQMNKNFQMKLKSIRKSRDEGKINPILIKEIESVLNTK